MWSDIQIMKSIESISTILFVWWKNEYKEICHVIQRVIYACCICTFLLTWIFLVCNVTDHNLFEV